MDGVLPEGGQLKTQGECKVTILGGLLHTHALLSVNFSSTRCFACVKRSPKIATACFPTELNASHLE